MVLTIIYGENVMQNSFSTLIFTFFYQKCMWIDIFMPFHLSAKK